MITQERINECLNDAMENGYDISTWTAEDIVIDLKCYASDCESSTDEELLPLVQTWLAARASNDAA